MIRFRSVLQVFMRKRIRLALLTHTRDHQLYGTQGRPRGPRWYCKRPSIRKDGRKYRNNLLCSVRIGRYGGRYGRKGIPEDEKCAGATGASRKTAEATCVGNSAPFGLRAALVLVQYSVETQIIRTTTSGFNCKARTVSKVLRGLHTTHIYYTRRIALPVRRIPRFHYIAVLVVLVLPV